MGNFMRSVYIDIPERFRLIRYPSKNIVQLRKSCCIPKIDLVHMTFEVKDHILQNVNSYDVSIVNKVPSNVLKKFETIKISMTKLNIDYTMELM